MPKPLKPKQEDTKKVASAAKKKRFSLSDLRPKIEKEAQKSKDVTQAQNKGIAAEAKGKQQVEVSQIAETNAYEQAAQEQFGTYEQDMPDVYEQAAQEQFGTYEQDMPDVYEQAVPEAITESNTYLDSSTSEQKQADETEVRVARVRTSSSITEEELSRASKKKKHRRRRKDRKSKTGKNFLENRQSRGRQIKQAKSRAKKEKAEREARARAEQMMNNVLVKKDPLEERLPFVGPIFKERRLKKKKNRKRSSSFFQRWQAKRVAASLKDVVGLDLGASCLRAVVLRDGKPIQIAEREIPPGIIIGGILERPEALSKELKILWQQGGIESNKVNFSIASGLVALRTEFLPDGPDDDIRKALSINAASVIEPMDPEESIIDYAPLSRSGPDIALQVAAADRDFVDTYVEALEDAGLVPVSCELGPLAASRALLIPRDRKKTHILIDIGASSTKFTICSGPDIFYMRVLSVGGNQFTLALQKEFSINWDQAEDLKKRAGLNSYPADPSVPADIHERCLRATRPILDQLCQEILQAKETYSATEVGRSRPLSGQATFIGGGVYLAGLVDRIVFFSKLIQGLPPTPRPEFTGVSDLITLSSLLGLGNNYQMSLLPEDKSSPFKPRRQAKLAQSKNDARRLRLDNSSQTNPLLVGGLVAILIIGGGFLWSRSIDKSSDTLRKETQLQQSLFNAQIDVKSKYWKQLNSSLLSQKSIQIISFNNSGKEIKLEGKTRLMVKDLKSLLVSLDYKVSELAVSKNGNFSVVISK